MCVTIQMKATEHYFQVVLFVFSQYFKHKFYMFFVFFCALIGVQD